MFINIFLIIITTLLVIFLIAYVITLAINIKDMIDPEFSFVNTNCKYRRWGCCRDNLTPKLDQNGTNCT